MSVIFPYLPFISGVNTIYIAVIVTLVYPHFQANTQILFCLHVTAGSVWHDDLYARARHRSGRHWLICLQLAHFCSCCVNHCLHFQDPV